MEIGIVRQDIIAQLSKSVHGDLESYRAIIGTACAQDPEFVAHLIAWDAVNGQVKDSKLALPVVTLASRLFPDELVENSLAHLALHPPRELVKAVTWATKLPLAARRKKALKALLHRYLHHKESVPQKFLHLVAAQRKAVRGLYKLGFLGAPEWANIAVFGRYKDQKMAHPPGTILADIANLHLMPPPQVAATIQKWHLSPLIIGGAMTGAAKKQEDAAVVQATMDQMSATQLTTRARSLEKKGAAKDPVLKEKFRKKVVQATTSKKATLKTSVAAEHVEDEGLREMLRELQERQIQSQKDSGRGIEGDWLVVVDRSSSQEQAITLGAHIGAAIAKFVTGKVWLIFCNEDVTPMEVTGKTLEQIMGQVKFIFAHGGTSYGVALDWALEKKLSFDGVVIVGDGGENTRHYAVAYPVYEKFVGRKIPTYFYKTYCPPQYCTLGSNTHPELFAKYMKLAGLDFKEFDFTKGDIDYYSIPNTVQALSANRFGVVEKIMACPLLTLDMVIPVGARSAA